MDSLLLSTLECLYSECCLSVLYYYMNQSLHLDTSAEWFQAHPLMNEQTTSRSSPNTTVATIVKKMMIEAWNGSSSFDRYFETCSPAQCTYSDTKQKKNSVGIVITLISTISGLTAALRWITPLLVRLALRLLQPRIRSEREGISTLDATRIGYLRDLRIEGFILKKRCKCTRISSHTPLSSIVAGNSSVNNALRFLVQFVRSRSNG